jgi:uncharacterized protein (DUF934 family)
MEARRANKGLTNMDMNRTVWKTVLTPAVVQQIQVPAGTEMLCAREQNEEICVWYRCDPDPNAIIERRKIAVIGTGHPAPADGRYLGTASLRGGSLMFHVFAWPPITRA